MHRTGLTGIAATAGVIVAAAVGITHAQTTRSAQDGVYTDAQAARGQALYDKQCASCHGQGLKGLAAPPLVGDVFAATWQGQPLLELASKIRNTMPADAPGTLSADRRGRPRGAHPEERRLPRRAAPSWRRPRPRSRPSAGPRARPPRRRPATVKAYPPLGNMAQLMRGIFFPNSNLLFTVQTRDPAAPAPKPTPEQQSQGFSVFDWGQGIYGGWQMIDNAAIALADAGPLMLTPGIRCENGRLAPVTDPDWIKYTEDMIAVAQQDVQAVAVAQPGSGVGRDRRPLRLVRRVPWRVPRGAHPRAARRIRPIRRTSRTAACRARRRSRKGPRPLLLDELHERAVDRVGDEDLLRRAHGDEVRFAELAWALARTSRRPPAPCRRDPSAPPAPRSR